MYSLTPLLGTAPPFALSFATQESFLLSLKRNKGCSNTIFKHVQTGFLGVLERVGRFLR